MRIPEDDAGASKHTGVFTICKILVIYIYMLLGTADGSTVVKVLCYKSEGRWFDSRWCHWNFSLT
jgi:hypothetical protein